MPTIGTSRMISKIRQERKRKPEMAIAAVVEGGWEWWMGL